MKKGQEDMKNMKKILALVVAMMLVVGMVSAFADVAANTYTITVTNTKTTVSIVGSTFKAYKLFDVTYTGSGSDDPHAYYLSTSNPFYTGTSYDTATSTWTYGTAANIIKDYFDFAYNANDTTKVYVSLKSNKTAADLYTMTQALIDANALPATENASAAGAVVNSVETAVIDVSNHGDAGYYVVTGEGTATANQQRVVAAAALTTTDPTAAIVAKLDAPTIDKKIDEHAGRTAIANGTYDVEDVTGNERSIGDDVPYIIKGTVPNMTGYEKYFYVVTDHFSGGLTFNQDVAITINGTTINAKPASNADANTVYYNLYYSKNNTDWVTSIDSLNPAYTAGDDLYLRIAFSNFISLKGTLQSDGTYSGDATGSDIIITYSATLNEEAIIGVDGNSNKAKLNYSNNPDDTGNGDDIPTNFNVTGETPEVETLTYTTGAELIKVETGSNPQKLLAGAIFEVAGEKVTNVVTYGTEFTQDNANGTYYKLKGNPVTYTTVSPLSDEIQNASNKDELLAKYSDPDGVEKFKSTQTKSVIQKTTGVHYQVTSGADGLLIFDGLGEGDYTFTEIKAPDGYNLLTEPINLKIRWTAPTDLTQSKECTWTPATGSDSNWQFVAGTGAGRVGRFEITVNNSKGTELPSTGGIGTTIFYVGGGLLVLLAVVLLVTKRRMNAND